MKHAKYSTYITGFGLSLVLTLASFLLVQRHVSTHHAALSHGALVSAITVFAITQLLVQLRLFLHVGQEPRPRWKLASTLFAGLVVVILVFGSLWIMNHLNYNMTSPTQSDTHIMHDEGITR